MQSMVHADWRMVLHTYLQAWSFRPSRLEPLYHIANFYREQQQYALGYHFARVVQEYPYPDDVLFVERDIYEFLLPIEYALCCQGTGRVDQAVSAFERVLAVNQLPEVWKRIAITGRELSQRGLSEAPSTGSACDPTFRSLG